MDYDIIYDKKFNNIQFIINKKIYNKKDYDLKEKNFEDYIENIKIKYLSYYNDINLDICNLNIDDIYYKLKIILFDAKILYMFFINYLKFDDDDYKDFNDKIDNMIILNEYEIIREELIIIKFFFIYTYLNHIYNSKN